MQVEKTQLENCIVKINNEYKAEITKLNEKILSFKAVIDEIKKKFPSIKTLENYFEAEKDFETK